MTAEIRFLPPARNYIKKIQDKKLKAELLSAIETISQDYTVGTCEKFYQELKRYIKMVDR